MKQRRKTPIKKKKPRTKPQTKQSGEAKINVGSFAPVRPALQPLDRGEMLYLSQYGVYWYDGQKMNLLAQKPTEPDSEVLLVDELYSAIERLIEWLPAMHPSE